MNFTGRYTIKSICAAGASAMALAAAASAQEPIAITEYRIQSDDCGLQGCGMPEFTSEADAIAFFEGDRAARAALASGASSDYSSYSSWRRSYSPWGFQNKQVVYLDFDAGGDPVFPVCRTSGAVFGVFNDYVYSQEERDAIQARIEADYEKFNYHFTQTEPTVGEYSTLLIGLNDAPLDCSQGSNITVTPTGGVSILFGRAENIDFRNQSKADNAFSDASFWAFLAQLDPSGGLFFAFSGINPADFGGDLAAALSYAVVNQTSNTSAHELGHIQGLRHHDSIGAPGDGLPDTGVPDPNDFIPVFSGPQNASETVLHTMASGASVGLSLEGSVITDRFFSERSAVKLSMARNASRVLEEDFFETTFWGKKIAKVLPLLPFYVPNTLVEGENAGKRLDADGLVIAGDISETGEVDEYKFFARKGKFVNIEMVSFSDTRFENPVIGAMRLSKLNWDGTRTEIASNIQTFEPFDPLIFDQELPETGIYVIEVDAPNIVYIDTTGDGVPDPFPLEETGNGSLRTGDYELAVYSVDGKLGRPHHKNYWKKRHHSFIAWNH
jgi:hypothetical protein